MSTLLIVIAILAGAVILGATLRFYLKARYREAVEAPELRNLASAAAPVAVAEEVRAIGDQIDRAMSEQRLQGETQRQLLAQKLDSVRQTIDQQRTHVDGLRSEMRHESKRRDVEISEIRAQLGTLHHAVGLPAGAQAALPPGPADGAPVAPSAPGSDADASGPAPPTSGLGPETFASESFSFGAAPEPAHAPSSTDVSGPYADYEDVPAAPAGGPPVEDRPPARPAAVESSASSWLPADPPAVAEATVGGGVFQEVTFDETPLTPFHSAPQEPSAHPTDAFAEVTFAPSPPAAPDSAAPEIEEDAPPYDGLDAPEAYVPDALPDEKPVDPFGEIDFLDLSRADSADREDAVADAPDDDVFARFDAQTPAGGDSVGSEPSISESWPEVAPEPHEPAAPADASEAAPAAPAFDATPAEPDEDVFGAGALPPSQAKPTAPDDAVLRTADVSEFSFADVVTVAPPPQPAAPERDAPSSTPPTGAPVPAESAWVARPTEAAPPRLGAAPAPAYEEGPPEHAPTEVDALDAPASDEPEPFRVPEGAETLTVISSIDEATQRLLYREGVTTLEEIAQWGRGDALRIGAAVDVSQETIMNAWVFEAQAALFTRYSEQVGG